MDHFIYFLMSKGEVIYIGCSGSMDSRIKVHKLNKPHDACRIMGPYSRDFAYTHESKLIRLFKPYLNGNCVKPVDELCNSGLLIRVSGELKARVNQYVADRKIPGGVSGMVRRFLEKKTTPKP